LRVIGFDTGAKSVNLTRRGRPDPWGFRGGGGRRKGRGARRMAPGPSLARSRARFVPGTRHPDVPGGADQRTDTAGPETA